MHRRGRRASPGRAAFWVVAAITSHLAQPCGPEAQALEADAGAATAPAEESPLQPLPELDEPSLPEATAAELTRLDASIERLLVPDGAARREALAHVREVDASWLPALAERFERLASSANRPALAVVLEQCRAYARAQAAGAERQPGAPKAARKPAKPASRRLPPMDALEAVVAYPDRSSLFLRPLTEALAYSRMFEAIGTLPAARRVLGVYIRLGEFLRADTEQAIGRLQDRSLAALIEATGHPTPRVGEWATGLLTLMGKRVASEAVQVQDPTLRADILRAYGKTRDVETARLLIAFAASERSPVRLAARQAVVLLGDAGLVHLRDAYAKTVGRRAPSDWSWQRVAQELFAAFDRQRSSELYRLYQAGLSAEQKGDLDAARAAFDQVLAYDPTFERGARMASVYVAFAEQRADSDAEAAILALRRAERLAPAGPAHDRALSLRYTLDALSLRQRGIVDEVLVERARELDPENLRAARLAADLEELARGDRARSLRYVAAALILALTLVALAVMGLRQRRLGRASRAARVDLR